MDQLVFELSQGDVENLINRPAPDETVSPDLYNVDEIISRLTVAELAICDSLHERNDDKAMNEFLIETAKIKARDGALGKIALNELSRKYLSTTSRIEIIPRAIVPSITDQVVIGNTSNRSSNIRPKTVRLRNRRSPNQVYRSR